MNQPWLGGKGKQAPYETATCRVPKDLLGVFAAIATQYKRMRANGLDTDTLVQTVEDASKAVTGKITNTHALEVDQLKAEIDNLHELLAAKETEIMLLRNFAQDRKAIARDLVSEYLNGKDTPKTRNWVEMNRFKQWLNQP